SNPLLDEVNLAGANGVLVNITAGPDFTMREFDEVGRIIEEFSSEDATVVIGTVLDPDMADEVRVTVVATGLGRSAARTQVRPDRNENIRETLRAPVKLVRNGSTGLADFDAMPPLMNHNGSLPPVGLGTPSINPGLRHSSRGGDVSSAPVTALADLPTDHSYLDIPAFLRRQAD
ncbi:MAG: cell division protein FtsZ, partial [Frankiaceae bacterium]|nr:cell division protein FtsZ [Arenimonas sp.]